MPEQVAVPPDPSIILQTWVRSITLPPIGTGALILFPPNAGLLQYTSGAVASICAFSIAFIAAPDAFAALMILPTYVPTPAQFAVAERSWKGAYCRSQVPELQTPDVAAPVVMIPWPFLFCQKPIVNAPVLGGTRQTVTEAELSPGVGSCSELSFVEKLAVLFFVTQPCDGAATVRSYVNVNVLVPEA